MYEFSWFIFTFVAFAFGVKLQKLSPRPVSRSLLPPMFSSMSFMVSDLIFKSLIHFEFVCIWCELMAQFHGYACSCLVFPTQFIEETVISPLYNLSSFLVILLTIYIWVYFWAIFLFHWTMCLFLCQCCTLLIAMFCPFKNWLCFLLIEFFESSLFWIPDHPKVFWIPDHPKVLSKNIFSCFSSQECWPEVCSSPLWKQKSQDQFLSNSVL